MAPPSLALRQFTFYHTLPSVDDDDDDSSTLDTNDREGIMRETRKVPVLNITAQLLSFGHRCFWVHLSESRESGSAPPPPFGPCAVAFAGVASELTSTALIDVSLTWQQGKGHSGFIAPNPQTVFAQSLAERLARWLQRNCCGPEGVAVYVACGIGGEKVELLGTPAGCGSDVTMRFGAEVFRNVLELIRKEGLNISTV